MNRRARSILWLDAGAGFAVGVAVLALRAWVARLTGFPPGLVLLIGAANLAYASYSGTLALRASRGKVPSRRAIEVLVAANLMWSVVCVVIIAATVRFATPYGIAYVGLEGVFVAVLAAAEVRWVRGPRPSG